jgi:hypothetical protein
MKIKKFEEKLVEVEEDRICNMCGKSCKCEMNINGLSAYVEGAYDSPCLEDNVGYNFDLCEKCLKNLFVLFKFKPETVNYNSVPEDYE